MNIEVLADSQAAAERGAAVIAEAARSAVAARGKFIVGVSGGRTPWVMLRALADEEVPWAAIHIVQVDERIAPAGHRDRNLTHLHQCLLERTPLPSEQIHAMPVEAPDLDAAAAAYATTLAQIAGTPVTLDLVHLGLGSDGHTASLVPGDPVLEIADADVGLTREYQGRRRLTLTYPLLDRAQRVMWLVTGSEKAAMLGRLLRKDDAIPAGRVCQERAVVIADRDAAGR